LKKSGTSGVYSRAEVYDVLFGWDRSAEFLFVDSLFQSYGLNLGDRILEVACGTGTCSVHLETLGWKPEGIDLSPAMIKAYNLRAKEQGRLMKGHVADMRNFGLDTKFKGAYCPLGSIGLLGDDGSMMSHFESMGRAMERNGLYLVDVGLNPEGTAPLDLGQVDWFMEGPSWDVHAVDGKVFLEDHQGHRLEELKWEGVPLEYEPSHFLSLIESSGVWEVLGIYPEADSSEEGISLFDPKNEGLSGEEDRAMIMLKKKETSNG